MTAKKIIIREVEEGDLQAIGNLLVDTWRVTYRGLVPDHFLDQMSPAHQAERVRRVMMTKPSCTYVAVG